MQNLKMATITLAGTIVYLGLAILGRGGFAAFFSIPALVAVALITAVSVIAALFSRGNVSAGVREERSNRWVLAAFTITGLLIAYVPAYTDRTGFLTFGGDTVRWIGVFLFTAGDVLRIWPVFVLGNRFSGLVAIQPGHRLVTTGVYGLVRNPSYLGLLVNSVGWSLAFRSVAGLVLTALLVPPLIARIHAEEKLLESQFGDEYGSYRSHTWRLIPWIY